MNAGMRITTNAMIRRYSTNLNNALGDLDSKRNTVATNRNFNKIAEDPAAAMKSFKLRSNFARTEVQRANTVDSLKKLDEVTSNVLRCADMGRDFIDHSLRGYSGLATEPETRQSLKQSVDKLVESFIQQMNGRYNENFIFAGASTKELPFSIDESGELLYRGISVDKPEALTTDDLTNIVREADPALTTDQVSEAVKNIMGDKTLITSAGVSSALASSELTTTQQQIVKDKAEALGETKQKKYETYMNEHSYRDIGFGLKEENGEVVSTSAFDTAVNGLQIFGHGLDKDGLPENIVSLAQELSKALGAEDFDLEQYDKIVNKMRSNYNDMIDNGLASLGTKAAFLEHTEDQLIETSQILNEQISSLDFCDPAEAITNLMWSQYAYNATLKVGNTLLSNSFIDFMS